MAFSEMPQMRMNPYAMNKMGKADGDGSGDLTPPPAAGDGSPPISTDGSGGSGGFQLPSWMQDQMHNFSGALSNPLLGPSLAAALQQFRQSRQYTDMAEHYANDPNSGLNPFGSQRGHYQDLLRDTFDDPAKVLANPAYQRFKQQGLDDVARTGAAGGYMGSGNMMKDLYDYSSSKDLGYLNQQQNNLMVPSGANIGPQSAAAMLMMGLQGRMGAENNAVGNLMLPFMNQSRNNDVNNPNGPNGGKKPTAGDYVNQATNLLQHPENLPPAMRSWNPQQMAQWLQYNKPLGNDSWGRFLTRGGDSSQGGYTSGDGTLDGHDDPIAWRGTGGDPSDDMSGWMGDGGSGGYGGGGDLSGGYGPGYGDNPFGDGSGFSFDGSGGGGDFSSWLDGSGDINLGDINFDDWSSWLGG